MPIQGLQFSRISAPPSFNLGPMAPALAPQFDLQALLSSLVMMKQSLSLLSSGWGQMMGTGPETPTPAPQFQAALQPIAFSGPSPAVSPLPSAQLGDSGNAGNAGNAVAVASSSFGGRSQADEAPGAAAAEPADRSSSSEVQADNQTNNAGAFSISRGADQ